MVPTSNLIGLSRVLNEFTQRTENSVWLNAKVITEQGVTQENTRTYIICVMTVEAGLHTEGTERKKKRFPAVPICEYEGRSASRMLWGPAHWGCRYLQVEKNKALFCRTVYCLSGQVWTERPVCS